MQLLKRASIKLFISIVGISIVLPSMITNANSSTVASLETIRLSDLLGGKTYGNIAAPENYTFESATSKINLVKGMPIASGISLGAVVAFKNFTPNTALRASGVSIDLNAVRADELEILKELPLKALLVADPSLKSIKAEAINWFDQGSKSLEDIAKTNLGNKPLPEAVLRATSIGQLGNIGNVAYGKYPGADNVEIRKFMGLADIPIAKLYKSLPEAVQSTDSASNGNNFLPVSLTSTVVAESLPAVNLPSGIHLIRIDKIRTREKGDRVNPKIVTGSDQRPKAQWTSSEPVDVVEIRDSIINDKFNLVNGAVMVDGSSQMIPGGNVPSPLQPAALAIPGTNLAVSAHSLNAKNGSARLQLNMRLEFSFGLRTAYFIPLPVPFTVTEKSKTTLLFPLEIPQPSPTIAIRIPSAASITALPKSSSESPATLSETTPHTETPSSVSDPVAINIANGNIGIAVKTNAINPANGA